MSGSTAEVDTMASCKHDDASTPHLGVADKKRKSELISTSHSSDTPPDATDTETSARSDTGGEVDEFGDNLIDTQPSYKPTTPGSTPVDWDHEAAQILVGFSLSTMQGKELIESKIELLRNFETRTEVCATLQQHLGAIFCQGLPPLEKLRVYVTCLYREYLAADPETVHLTKAMQETWALRQILRYIIHSTNGSHPHLPDTQIWQSIDTMPRIHVTIDEDFIDLRAPPKKSLEAIETQATLDRMIQERKTAPGRTMYYDLLQSFTNESVADYSELRKQLAQSRRSFEGQLAALHGTYHDLTTERDQAVFERDQAVHQRDQAVYHAICVDSASVDAHEMQLWAHQRIEQEVAANRGAYGKIRRLEARVADLDKHLVAAQARIRQLEGASATNLHVPAASESRPVPPPTSTLSNESSTPSSSTSAPSNIAPIPSTPTASHTASQTHMEDAKMRAKAACQAKKRETVATSAPAYSAATSAQDRLAELKQNATASFQRKAVATPVSKHGAPAS